MHSSSMNNVQIRLVHLWTAPHRRRDLVVAVNFAT
ncbi:hypothetical protein ACVWW1_004989 [Bradyrhizobium sp. JR3.5]